MALKVKDDKQKLAFLLNYIGEEVYDIYDSLLIPGADETYENAIRLLDERFSPKSNVNYKIYLFWKLQQRSQENTSIFYTCEAASC